MCTRNVYNARDELHYLLKNKNKDIDIKQKYNMGAAIFNNKGIMAIGEPSFDRSSAFGMNKVAMHAEEEACRKVYSRYAKYFGRIITGKMKFTGNKKTDLIVMKINKSDQFTNSKCCSVCYSIMKAFSIRNIYYYNELGELVKEKINDFKPDYSSSGFDYYFTLIKGYDIKNNIMFIINNKLKLKS